MISAGIKKLRVKINRRSFFSVRFNVNFGNKEETSIKQVMISTSYGRVVRETFRCAFRIAAGIKNNYSAWSTNDVNGKNARICCLNQCVYRNMHTLPSYLE